MSFEWQDYQDAFYDIEQSASDTATKLWDDVNLTASYIADYIRSLGGDSADDAVPMGTFVQGYAYCNMVDADAVSHTDVRTSYRLSSVPQNGNILFSNDYVTYRLYRDTENYPVATTSPSLNYSTSNGGYYYTATSSTSGWLFHGTFGQLVNDPTTNTIQVYLENRSNETTFSYTMTSAPSTVRLDRAQMKLSNTWSNSDIYLPQLTGNKSYTDARQILTDYYNTNIVLIDPDAELIVVTDLPDFQDATFPTETETESETTSNFPITPEDVVDPSEMYEVLTTETYEIPEYDTEYFTESDTYTYDVIDNTDDTELLAIAGFIPDAISRTYTVLDAWGIAGVFLVCASIGVAFKIFNRK